MNPIVAVAVFTLLIVIRLAVPCALVGGFCFVIDRLYQRWDEEAGLSETMIVPK